MERGDSADCSLRVEITQPDSTNDFNIETLSMVLKQMEI
jgi:hypothetical protein